jgi:hypothetical protein
MITNSINNTVVFKIDAEVAIVPASDGRLTYGWMFHIGQPEAIEHFGAKLSRVGQCSMTVALLANRD